MWKLGAIVLSYTQVLSVSGQKKKKNKETKIPRFFLSLPKTVRNHRVSSQVISPTIHFPGCDASSEEETSKK